MEEILQTLATAPSELIGQYIGFLRYAVPVMTFLLLLRCAFPLLTFRREPEIWAWLNLTDGTQIPITHWENVIGRSKSCDVTIDFSTISRNHAVLTRYDDGSWTLLDIGSKTGTFVNDRPIQICALKPKDRISIGGVEMQLQPITQRQEVRQAQLRTKAASGWDSVTNLMLLTILQCAILLGYLLRGKRWIFPIFSLASAASSSASGCCTFSIASFVESLLRWRPSPFSCAPWAWRPLPPSSPERR